MPFIVPKKRTSLSRSQRFSRYKDVERSPGDLLVLQQRKKKDKPRKKPRKVAPEFRVITVAYPRYEVAYGIDLDSFRTKEWAYCCETLPGLVPKDLEKGQITKWLIAHFTTLALAQGGDYAATQPRSEDEKEKASDSELSGYSPPSSPNASPRARHHHTSSVATDSHGVAVRSTANGGARRHARHPQRDQSHHDHQEPRRHSVMPLMRGQNRQPHHDGVESPSSDSGSLSDYIDEDNHYHPHHHQQQDRHTKMPGRKASAPASMIQEQLQRGAGGTASDKKKKKGGVGGDVDEGADVDGAGMDTTGDGLGHGDLGRGTRSVDSIEAVAEEPLNLRSEPLSVANLSRLHPTEHDDDDGTEQDEAARRRRRRREKRERQRPSDNDGENGEEGEAEEGTYARRERRRRQPEHVDGGNRFDARAAERARAFVPPRRQLSERGARVPPPPELRMSALTTFVLVGLIFNCQVMFVNYLGSDGAFYYAAICNTAFALIAYVSWNRDFSISIKPQEARVPANFKHGGAANAPQRVLSGSGAPGQRQHARAPSPNRAGGRRAQYPDAEATREAASQHRRHRRGGDDDGDDGDKRYHNRRYGGGGDDDGEYKSAAMAPAADDGRVQPGQSIVFDDLDTAAEPMPHTWSFQDGSTFLVRSGPNYAKLGTKKPSGPCLYDVICIDILGTPRKVPELHKYVRYPEARPGSVAERYGVPDVFVINACFPAYPPSNPIWGAKKEDGESWHLVVYCRLSEAGERALEDGVPAARVLQNFIRDMEDPKMQDRFKVVPRVNDRSPTQLPNMLQRYNGKPFLSRPQHQFFRHGEGCVEAFIDVHKFQYVAKKTFNGFINSKFPYMIVDVGFVIESRGEEEMPEQLLSAITICQLELDKTVVLPIDD